MPRPASAVTDAFGLGWYHYGARFYDGATARWTTMDPADEFNSPYVYVGGDPVNLVDPDGRQACNKNDERYNPQGCASYYDSWMNSPDAYVSMEDRRTGNKIMGGIMLGSITLATGGLGYAAFKTGGGTLAGFARLLGFAGVTGGVAGGAIETGVQSVDQLGWYGSLRLNRFDEWAIVGASGRGAVFSMTLTASPSVGGSIIMGGSGNIVGGMLDRSISGGPVTSERSIFNDAVSGSFGGLWGYMMPGATQGMGAARVLLSEGAAALSTPLGIAVDQLLRGPNPQNVQDEE